MSGPVAAWFKSAEGRDVLKDVCEQTRVDRIDLNPTTSGCKLKIKADDSDLTSLANMLLNIHIENQGEAAQAHVPGRGRRSRRSTRFFSRYVSPLR